MATFIHPSSIVDPLAELGVDVEIGPFCRVGPHVKVGDRSRLLSHVVVEGWTTLGTDNTVFPFAVLGAIPQDLKYRGEPTQLIIGNHNTLRESVTLNLGTVQGGGKTVLGDHNLVMAYVHFGHDCIVGNHTILANSVGLAGHVIVEDYATIGGMAGVIQFMKIGKYSYVGGKATVDRDVVPYSIVIGERPCGIKGTNIVGLKRKGFSSEVISAINETLRLWRRPDVTKDQCLAEIEAAYGSVSEVRDLIAFIRSSENGCTK